MISLNFNQIRILSLLCCAIVPLLVTGPFLPDLLVSFLSLWFIYYVLKHRAFYLFKNKFFYVFIIFCAYCILSSIMSDNILLSLESSLFYFRIGIFSMLISYLISQNKIILNYFFYSLIITFSLLTIYAIVQYLFQLHAHPYRISSLFGDELILGSYLSRLLPLIIALYIIRENKSYKEIFFFIIFLALTYLSIFLSGERSAFFYVNMSLLFILLFLRINIKFLISLVMTIVIALFIFSKNYENNEFNSLLIDRYTKNILNKMNISNFLNKNKDIKKNKSLDENISYIDTFLTKSTRVYKNSNIVFFTAGHESLYRTALNMFLDRPIVGHGPKMFRVKCSKSKYAVVVNNSSFGSCMTHPHNFYIQLLAETGIIGFSFLFSVFIYLSFLIIKYLYFNYFKKKKIYSNYNICILACVLITIWPLIPNGNFFNNYLMILYSLPLGFFKKENKI